MENGRTGHFSTSAPARSTSPPRHSKGPEMPCSPKAPNNPEPKKRSGIEKKTVSTKRRPKLRTRKVCRWSNTSIRMTSLNIEPQNPKPCPSNKLLFSRNPKDPDDRRHPKPPQTKKTPKEPSDRSRPPRAVSGRELAGVRNCPLGAYLVQVKMPRRCRGLIKRIGFGAYSNY